MAAPSEYRRESQGLPVGLSLHLDTVDIDLEWLCLHEGSLDRYVLLKGYQEFRYSKIVGLPFRDASRGHLPRCWDFS
jgi:hypothetical protein